MQLNELPKYLNKLFSKRNFYMPKLFQSLPMILFLYSNGETLINPFEPLALAHYIINNNERSSVSFPVARF
jgi:hypothetical protein